MRSRARGGGARSHARRPLNLQRPHHAREESVLDREQVGSHAVDLVSAEGFLTARIVERVTNPDLVAVLAHVAVDQQRRAELARGLARIERPPDGSSLCRRDDA